MPGCGTAPAASQRDRVLRWSSCPWAAAAARPAWASAPLGLGRLVADQISPVHPSRQQRRASRRPAFTPGRQRQPRRRMAFRADGDFLLEEHLLAGLQQHLGRSGETPRGLALFDG